MKVSEFVTLMCADVYGMKKERFLTTIQIDSRKIKRHNTFLALIGKVRDGHDYIEEAIQRGASIVICSRIPEVIHRHITYLVVRDTNQALAFLGMYQKEKYAPFCIAITGSVGKTTTKELIYHILKSKYQVLASEKNYNNHIGLPLTLLNCSRKYSHLVLELGMNHAGEMHELSCLCKPDIAVITNIGTSHIGNFKSRRHIRKAKLEILDGMDHGVCIVNGRDPYLKRLKHKKISIQNAYDNITILHSMYFFHGTYLILSYRGVYYPVWINIPGKKLVDLVLLAITVCLHCGFTMEEIVKEISTFQLSSGRGKQIKIGSTTIIDDCYNASLESMQNAFFVLSLADNHKIAILGDILELGSKSYQIHKKVLKNLRKYPDIQVLLIGKMMKKVRQYVPNSKWFMNQDLLCDYLDHISLTSSTILVKGSHGMELSKTIEHIKKSLS